MLKNIKGAIFDLDGTLVDSMWIWDKVDIDYLKNHNINLPKSLKDDVAHLSFDQSAHYFKDNFTLPYSIEEIKNQWMNMAYKEYKENVFLKPGVHRFLDTLKKSGIKIGLATSNCLPLLEVALKSNNIYDYFDAITITDEVCNGKKHPDVYLLAAKKLGINPDNCVVFEDILPALQGAKAAGMKVVCISDKYNDYTKEQVLEYADVYIDSYDEMID